MGGVLSEWVVKKKERKNTKNNNNNLQEYRLADRFRAAILRSLAGWTTYWCRWPARREAGGVVSPLPPEPARMKNWCWSCSRVCRRPRVSLTQLCQDDNTIRCHTRMSCNNEAETEVAICCSKLRTCRSSNHPCRSKEVLTRSRPSLARVRQTIAVPRLSSHWTASTSAKLT